MQIPQVTAPTSASEPVTVEGEKPATKNGEGGEKGAFAILLALLQGSAPAQPGTAPGMTEGSGTGEAAPANGGQSPGASSASSQNVLLVAGDATAASGEAAQTAKNASAKSNEAAPANPPPEHGKAVSTVKPVIVTQVVTPSPPDGAKQTSSAQYVVPELKAAASEPGAPTKPVNQTAPANVPVAEAETGIPVAKLIDAEGADVTVETKQAAPAKPEAEPKAHVTDSRSTARFIVAKPDTVAAESPTVKAEGTTETLSPTSSVTPKPGSDGGGDAVAEVLDGEEAAIPKDAAKVPVRTASSQVQHVDGARPATVEPPPPNAVIQVEHAAPSNGSERVKAEVDPAAPPERTTVKTIAIDTVKGVRYLLTKGEQTMRIRLVPESLGELKLVVTSTNDEITVRLASANHSVRELLHTQVHQLREVLAQDGSNVGKITITADLNAGAGTGNPLSGSPERAWTPHARGWNGNTPGPSNQNPSNGQQPGAVPRRPLSHGGSLNLFA
ncbi:MAG: flagellar hook-length control protein FliK [Candidatus Hydrogenedentes bacterium]|nr:flagellar hook-length control protein FliK [Candidatus Hydrogenedentota bacterium]